MVACIAFVWCVRDVKIKVGETSRLWHFVQIYHDRLFSCKERYVYEDVCFWGLASLPVRGTSGITPHVCGRVMLRFMVEFTLLHHDTERSNACCGERRVVSGWDWSRADLALWSWVLRGIILLHDEDKKRRVTIYVCNWSPSKRPIRSLCVCDNVSAILALSSIVVSLLKKFVATKKVASFWSRAQTHSWRIL